MRQIIKYNTINYETLHIREDQRVLDVLKQDAFCQFRLQRVSPFQFMKFQEAERKEEILDFYYNRYIVGYNPFVKGDSFRSSGGLKISSDEDDFIGSFVIDNERIIYTPLCKFYEERDSFVYSGTDYYTTMTMPEIVAEELIENRKFFIDMGEELRGFTPCPVLEEVSSVEMLEYATDPSKGKTAYEKRRKYWE